MKRVVLRVLRSLLAPLLLLVGIYAVAIEPIILPIGLLVAIGVLGRQTRPPGRRAASRADLIAGLVAYPAICVGIDVALGNEGAIDAAAYLSLPVTALIVGVVLGRLWVAAVPVVLAAAIVLIGYINDPTCSSCGESTWGYSVAMTGLLFVAPSVLMVEIGVLIHNLWWRRRHRPLFSTPSGDGWASRSIWSITRSRRR